MVRIIEISIGADILVATMLQGKSHIGSMVPLLKELVRQGHNVTIYMEQYGESLDFSVGLNKWYINLTDHPFPLAITQEYGQIWHKDYNSFDAAEIFYYASVSCGYVLEEHKAEFERIASYPWDLLLTDSLFSTCGYGLSLLSKANHIIMHTSSVEDFYAMAKGFGRQYTIAPPYFMNSWHANYDVRNFFHRLTVAYELFSMWLSFGTISNYFMRKTLAPLVPNFDFTTHCRTASMSFTDMPLHLYVPEPLNNELFSYGAYCMPYDKLNDAKLVNFLDDPKSNGTIILAFGTILRLKYAPRKFHDILAETLNQLTSYRIIWACTDCPSMKLNKHIRVLSWIPQTDLLHHSKSKLFITHGGLKSLKEALCAKIPTLFLPVFGEQVRNSWLAQYHGFGRVINRFNITTDHFLNLIHEMLHNPTYKQRAEKLRRYYDDAPISPIKEAAFRINRLLKYGGRFYICQFAYA
uniref:UDP-glucuronosyltransferase n=1 Tax=Loa loa TaxID=7209 RepID=A0A1I7VHN8_LOALO